MSWLIADDKHPPAAAANQFSSFDKCCKRGWNRPNATSLVGNGYTDSRCFLAVGSLAPPCWIPYQNQQARKCVTTQVAATCFAGKQHAAAAAAADVGVDAQACSMHAVGSLQQPSSAACQLSGYAAACSMPPLPSLAHAWHVAPDGVAP
jgi:hypothetical protein